MEARLAAYAAQRDRLLSEIVGALQHDDRIVAAWLAGSMGRGDADDLSDLDVVVVVADPYADTLCQREFTVGAGTTPGRLAIISKFGTPAVIHENSHNAPAGGTFTVVIYADGAQGVDWTFVPHASACRQDDTLLLFDQVGVKSCPPREPLGDDSRRHRLAERHAFFWMMILPTLKYAQRGDSVYFHVLLDMLDRTASEIERLLQHEPWTYQRGSQVELSVTPEEQIQAVKTLAVRVQALESALSSAGVENSIAAQTMTELLNTPG